MEYIALILGILLILEIKFSPRFNVYLDRKHIYLYFYWKTTSTFGEVYRNNYHLKIKFK